MKTIKFDYLHQLNDFFKDNNIKVVKLEIKKLEKISEFITMDGRCSSILVDEYILYYEDIINITLNN